MINTLNLTNSIDLSHENIIEIENLNFSFSNKTCLFQNAKFYANFGDFVCICGENGCGKSTFLKILLNLINHSNKIKTNAKNIGYVPQSINFNKDFPITVKEFLKYNCKELKASFSHALNLLDKYNLQNTLNTLVGKLSGGQLQKIMLIRALLKNTDLLIIDEPTNNLDEKSKEIIYSELKELNKENITIIVVEHNRELVNKYSNKVFLIENGDINLV